jgi:hypothetical protein
MNPGGFHGRANARLGFVDGIGQEVDRDGIGDAQLAGRARRADAKTRQFVDERIP